MDHYYNFGKSDLLMKEMIAVGAMIVGFGLAAIIYIKRSVNRDFAILRSTKTQEIKMKEKLDKSQAIIEEEDQDDLDGYDMQDEL